MRCRAGQVASAEPDGAAERWRVDHRSGPRSARLWEDALGETHAAFDVRLPDPDAFVGSVRRWRLGALSMVDCFCTPFVGHRGAPVMADRAEGLFGLQMVLRGHERAWAGRREVIFAAGDLTIWDGTRSGDIEVLEPFAKRTLVLPRGVAQAVCPRLGTLDAGVTISSGPASRLLARYLEALAEELPGLDAATADVAVDVVLDLLRAALEPHLPPAEPAHREALRARARRYVRARLGSPDLGPAAIAAALSVSVRTLHAAFADSGESVAGYVRSARLARCHEDLVSGAGSVTEIAYRWGFSEPTHFAHAFKREFGMTPREARLAGAPPGPHPS